MSKSRPGYKGYTKQLGYGLLATSQVEIKSTLAGECGGGLAIQYAEEIMRLQKLLRVAIERVERLEEERATCPSS